MKSFTLFGRKPISLLLTAVLVSSCSTGYYYLYQANAKLTPVLPPLAAQRNIQQWLEQNMAELADGEPLFHLDVITEIYRRTDYKLLWLHNYELSPSGQHLLQLLYETSADDVMEYDYHLAYLRQRLHHLPTRPKDATAVDILLTDAFITLAEDIHSQKLLPTNIAQLQNPFKPAVMQNDVINADPHTQHQTIINMVADNSRHTELTDVLENFAPDHSQYRDLRDALSFYQTVASSNIWRPFTRDVTLRENQEHDQVAQLRELLHAYGDYPVAKNNRGLLNWFNKHAEPENTTNLRLFDAELVAALKQFQLRHGKPATGRLDDASRELLNISPSFRIKQIAFNMKRWREMPTQLQDRYIWVNMPDYQLHLMEHGKSVLNMKVIVGKVSRRTPIMQEPINSIVLNPMWNVPRRIMIQDILPKVKKDPEYLSKRNIRIIDGWQNDTEVPVEQLDFTKPLRTFPYRLQQAAGEDNALGVVKFVIPNDASIYLHDTNQPELFGEDYRALSSGCIRVADPMLLAETLLRGKQGWNRQQLDKVLATGKTQYLSLPESVPTYLTYWTAWVDEAGRVQFRDDIYNEDAPLQTRTSYAQQASL